MLIASGQAEHRPPGSQRDCDSGCNCGGRSWHQTPSRAVKPHPYFLFFSPQVEKKNGCCVHWTTTNPATTAALICSCLTISAITIMSGLLRVLKSAQLTCNSSLRAQKFLHHRGQGQLRRMRRPIWTGGPNLYLLAQKLVFCKLVSRQIA